MVFKNMESKAIFSKPPEYYEKIHEEALLRAVGWEMNGENVTNIELEEPNLEEHFEKHWGKDDENYRKQIHVWRGNGVLKDLTRINHKDKDYQSYVVDTSDLVMGTPNDEFFFVQIGTCWGVTVDVDVDGIQKRVAYHMPGITKDKGTSLDELFKHLGKLGKISNINIFYGAREYKPEEIEEVTKKLDGFNLNFMNLDEKVEWGARDIFVKGQAARQYFNQGVYSENPDEIRVDRVYAGEWALK